MRVPLIDLAAQYASIKREIDDALARVAASQRFVLGPVVRECEEALAGHVGSAHGVGVSSGTDALLIALMAEGIGPGDEVVTTPFSFFATVGAVVRCGATPVFADIDPVTFNLDPARIEERVTGRTRAILPVHLFGQMADMAPIMEIARRHGLIVIEDAAQAIGARRDGRSAGSVGHYGCLSFFPTKNLGGFGDGGIVFTDDPERAERLRVLRVHGETTRYRHRLVGGNFRLDALQAAVILAKLPHLDRWTDARIAHAARYRRLLEAQGRRPVPGLALPHAAAERHVFHQFVVRVRGRHRAELRRDHVRARLDAAGIGTAIYYPVPLHLQECLAELGHGPGDLPESERAAREVLAMPIVPELTAAQVRLAARELESACRAATRTGGRAR